MLFQEMFGELKISSGYNRVERDETTGNSLTLPQNNESE